MTVGVRLLIVAVVIGGSVLFPARGGRASGPFDLMRGWSGGPWDYQYPWAGCGYPSFGFGTPYTWDQPLGVGQAGPYIWGAPFASPSLYLPGEPGPSESSAWPGAGAEPQAQPVPPADALPADPQPEAGGTSPSAAR
jgi:hypothetical protein